MTWPLRSDRVRTTRGHAWGQSASLRNIALISSWPGVAGSGRTSRASRVNAVGSCQGGSAQRRTPQIDTSSGRQPGSPASRARSASNTCSASNSASAAAVAMSQRCCRFDPCTPRAGRAKLGDARVAIGVLADAAASGWLAMCGASVSDATAGSVVDVAVGVAGTGAESLSAGVDASSAGALASLTTSGAATTLSPALGRPLGGVLSTTAAGTTGAAHCAASSGATAAGRSSCATEGVVVGAGVSARSTPRQRGHRNGGRSLTGSVATSARQCLQLMNIALLNHAMRA